MNSATGQMLFDPFAVQLFGAGTFTSGPLTPWTLSVSLPLGAIVFWWKRLVRAAGA
jgi:hypothetical protein